MAINKSFHQAAVGWLLQALFVLWYARGLPGLLDFALREGNCKNIWVIFWKKVKCCDLDWIIAVSHGSMPQGALDCTHRQPYRPNGGAIKDMGNNFDFRFQLHGKSPSSFTSCFLAAVLCFGRWLAKWRVHSKRSVAWLQSWKEVRDQEIPRDHRFPARNRLPELLTCLSRSMAIW